MDNIFRVIKKPIFIIGTGRCGSSLLYRILALHPELAFLSNINEKFNTMSSIILRINVMFNKILLKKNVVKPSESYKLFSSVFPGYAQPIRTLKTNEVTPTIYKGIKNLVGKSLKYERKERFLYKYTGWSRIGFFNKIFPDSLFIHIIRDGRAVVNSLLKVPWWSGWRGPQSWRWGEIPEKYKIKWLKSESSFVLLAAIEWKLILDEIEESRKLIRKDQFIQIRYEDLVKDLEGTIRKITDFSEISFNDSVRNEIFKIRIENMNYKWKSELQDSEKKLINDFLKDYLDRYKYK